MPRRESPDRKRARMEETKTKIEIKHYQKSHRYAGTWQGRQVSFKDSWANHAFTYEEAALLLGGQELKVPFTDKSGQETETKGALGYSEYEGRRYFGFIPCFATDYPGPAAGRGSETAAPHAEQPSGEETEGANQGFGAADDASEPGKAPGEAHKGRDVRAPYQGETIFGMDADDEPVVLGTNTWETGLNNNLLVLGPSGSGKTRYVLKPNLLQMGASYIVLDTKGTLDQEVGPTLERHGYKVWTLDFAHDMQGNVGYDPLHAIRQEKEDGEHTTANDQDVLTIVNAVCPIERKEDPYWDRQGGYLLASLIHAVIEKNGDSANFSDVVGLYNGLYDGERNKRRELDRLHEELDAADKISDIKQRAETRKEIHNEINKTEDKDYLEFCTAFRTIEELGEANPNSHALTCFDRIASVRESPKTFRSITAVLDGHMTVFLTSGARAMYKRKDKVDFTLLAQEKIVLFVTISDHDASLRPLTSLFVTQAFSQLLDFADKQPGGMLPNPVRFFLDDFSNLDIRDMADTMAIVRSREIWVTMLCQSVNQLYQRYGTYDGGSIIANCDAHLILGFCDLVTAKEFAERARKQAGTLLETQIDRSWLFLRGRRGREINRYRLELHPLYGELGEKPRNE